MSKIVKIALVFVLIIALLQESITTVNSAVFSYSVSLDTHELSMNLNSNINFNVTNIDSTAYRWVRFAAPSGEYTTSGTSSSDWSQTYTDFQATYDSGTRDPGGSKNLTISITSGNDVSTQDWSLQVSKQLI